MEMVSWYMKVSRKFNDRPQKSKIEVPKGNR